MRSLCRDAISVNIPQKLADSDYRQARSGPWKPSELPSPYSRTSSLTVFRFPSAAAVFATAAQRFYDQLSQDEKENFQSLDNPSDMIASIEQHIIVLKSQGSRTARLLNCCRKIEQFSKAMEPFFKIVDMFISSHPDWAAIVWGAIRMVFQVGMSLLFLLSN
jgi:hypothetical protein